MRAYSLDLRTQLMDAMAQGIDRHEAARVFGVSLRTIRRYQQQLATSGSLAAKPIPGRPRQISRAHAPLLEAQLRAHPDATLVEQCQLWQASQQIQVSPATMSRAIARLGWTWKKKVLVASERDDVARREWRDEVAEFDAQQFVFVDESSANITLTPRYGWAPHNERAVGQAPRNYPHNLTLVAALTPSGMQAPMTFPKALTGDAFVAYVAQVLVPTLHPGQLVILDNLSCHKRAEIAPLLTAAGCTLRFLPAYSPDFTPIEQAFSKLKHQLRRAQARTAETLEAAVTAALATISAQDAHAWFHHVGYTLDDQRAGQPL